MADYVEAYCTVCGQPCSPPHMYGERAYCDTHIHQFWQDVPPVWRSTGLTFGVMLMVAAGTAIAGGILGIEPTGFARLSTSALVAMSPALIWMIILYRFSAPTPYDVSPLLPTVFVLSALIAAAITRPLLLELLDLDVWLTRANAANRLSGNILIAGMLHCFVLYGVVRYSVWRTPAFEHRVDGVIFNLAAGWGYAAMWNTLFALDRGGLSLINGSLYLLARTCAFIAPSIVIGYFLGRNRFEDLPVYYLTLGVLGAGVLNGLLLYATTELNVIRLRITSDAFTPWPGFVVGMLLMIAAYAAVYGLIRRHNALTEARLEMRE